MKSISHRLAALSLAFCSQTALADGPPSSLIERQVAACGAWAVRLDRTIDLMRETKALADGDAAASAAVVSLLARRCQSSEAARISQLLVVTLDVLTDAPNQP
jgi:hypothetical protein